VARKNKTYQRIVKAIKDGKLKEPFNVNDVKAACPDLNKNTVNGFLSKRRVRNPGKYLALFVRHPPFRYSLIRPFKYGF
jgi:hypothetical protein